MDFIISGLQFLLFLFWVLLFARIIFSWVMVFQRDWRPTGMMLLVTEGVFTVTDPPIRAIRKVVPPLSMGSIRIDLAILIVFFIVIVLSQLLARLQ